MGVCPKCYGNDFRQEKGDMSKRKYLGRRVCSSCGYVDPECLNKGPITDPFGWFLAKCVFCRSYCNWAEEFRPKEG